MQHLSTKKAAGFLAGLLAIGGLATTITANAAEVTATGGPTIKLTSVDTDIIVASGRNFSTNTDIALEASSTSLKGTGTVKSDATGRFLVAFKLPAGFDDQLDVVSKTPDATASIDIVVPGDGVNTTTSTTTASTSSTSSTSTSTTAPTSSTSSTSTTSTTAATGGSTTSTTAPTLDPKVGEVPGAAAFNAKNAEFNAVRLTTNAKLLQLNTSLSKATPAQRTAVASKLTALNTKIESLNAATKASNDKITALNAAAAKAKTDAELQALAPQLADLTASVTTRIAIVQSIGVSTDEIIALLPA